MSQSLNFEVKVASYQSIKLTSLDLSNFDTSKVTSMNNMFGGCRNLTKIMVGSKWIINSGTNTTNMFYNCGTQTVTKQ